jgi:uncharacterized protein (TIGR00725 family)
MKIGICGSSTNDQAILSASMLLGKAIGERKHDVIIGANTHLPYLIAATAYKLGSRVIAYAPSTGRWNGDPENIFNEVHFLPEVMRTYSSDVRTKIRNMIMVGNMDAAIFVAGRWGTTTEFGAARDFGIPVAMLKGSSGAADALPRYLQEIEGKYAFPPPVYSDDPAFIVAELEAQFAEKQNALLRDDMSED